MTCTLEFSELNFRKCDSIKM